MESLPIRAILVSTDRLTSAMLAAAIATPPDITVVDTLLGVESLPLHLGTFDVAILHARLPQHDIAQATKIVRESAGGASAIVIGTPNLPSLVVSYFEAGARGHVPVDAPVTQLHNAVRWAHAGTTTVTPELAHALVRRLTELSRTVDRHRFRPDKGAPLSRREREVLEYIDRGLSNQQIAALLSIQAGTVKNHVHNILAKLQVRNRRQASAWLHRQRERSPDGRWHAASDRVRLTAQNSNPPA